jgi:hypothetical protein
MSFAVSQGDIANRRSASSDGACDRLPHARAGPGATAPAYSLSCGPCGKPATPSAANASRPSCPPLSRRSCAIACSTSPPPLRPVLLRLSPATIDRLLRPHRRGHPRGIAITGPSSPALAAQVPIRTFGDWQAFRLGSFQADLVAHNGGEFLNHILVPWCRRERIHFTRGRPHRKNDQAYAEQKNWAIVRRLIGYNYPHSSVTNTNDEILC